MSKIVVKALKYEDIGGIIKVENMCFKSPWQEQSFVEELNNPIALYYVAFLENQVVGYAGMWLVLDEAHISNVAVHPIYQRRGIATLLMEELIANAEDKDMTLEVRPSNLKAINLYKNFGFIEAGIRKHYYSDNNENAIIMWRRVGGV